MKMKIENIYIWRAKITLRGALCSVRFGSCGGDFVLPIYSPSIYLHFGVNERDLNGYYLVWFHVEGSDSKLIWEMYGS